MDALILAAGLGSRISAISPAKPLTLVGGVALLDIALRQAAFAGASRAIVVTGHRAAELEAALPGFARAAGIPVEAQRVAEWSRPNGHSVIAGAARISGDYLLMMADHILSPPILGALARQGGADRGVTLAIDRRVDGAHIDPQDATWVSTDQRGFIRAIGKTLTHYDAVDCGAFLATPELADAISAAIASGLAGSLSEGMQRLADGGRAATVDIGSAWWIDVDDPRAHAIAEADVSAHLPRIYATGKAGAARVAG